ncbi:hypothetical protein ACHQM5_000817 [Ranunculus cassubicifolius]
MADAAELYRVLLNRFQDLDQSHAELTKQMQVLVKKKEIERQSRRREESGWTWDRIPGVNSFSKVLQSMGHAVHVCRAFDGKIIFWNRSAENLYGWKEYEALGQRATDLITDELYHSSIEKIMESLITGQSWSGQFPFKKRSGEVFTALVTKSPLYEDGELVGVITVSSDADLFNINNSDIIRTYQDHAYAQSKEKKPNMKKVRWQTKPQISSVSQISTSFSNLASKVFSLRAKDDDICSTCASTRGRGDPALDSADRESDNVSSLEVLTDLDSYSKKEESILGFVQPSKLAAKVREKLKIGGDNNKVQDECKPPCDPDYIPAKNAVQLGLDCASLSLAAYLNHQYIGILEKDEFDGKGIGFQGRFKKDFTAANDNPFITSWLEDNECPDELLDSEALHQNPPASPPIISSSAESNSSRENSLTKEDRESLESLDECEILWDDLHLGEEIGQGAYAIVYRGIWDGSEVAVKVYSENDYSESTLMDFKKEIAIMKRLRHPNVLLFMGAVYSPERLAIVTEFLPRGSLFRTLHKSNQALDVRKRLRMSLDVARGMNYLHHRSPPIVHRDLKSSNLLVDRNLTVKVGDFGLSKWKHTTYLTAKSGRGTPQWMAPEVLRNELSNEKSDVFSFGVILWELLTESIPWAELNPLQVVGVVGFMDRRLELPESLDPRLSSVINDCWQRLYIYIFCFIFISPHAASRILTENGNPCSDPASRPSFKDLILRMSNLIKSFPAGTPCRSMSGP